MPAAPAHRRAATSGPAAEALPGRGAWPSRPAGAPGRLQARSPAQLRPSVRCALRPAQGALLGGRAPGCR